MHTGDFSFVCSLTLVFSRVLVICTRCTPIFTTLYIERIYFNIFVITLYMDDSLFLVRVH